ncbi:ketimine reductase mu-crystallin-like isoform X1 [Saccostrea echinata]|uniref:ketimine reductase mu-crystallin-like isoform X1 n=1 Tax=Saccostrea echinata TaxID=191078 RepID=UPI002A808432|nr:ketimine reductase mu-crystallin-like isoform X1 [Saccostrea echinata]
MDIKFIPAEDVKKVLQYNDLIPQMESALKKFSSKSIEHPVRSIVQVKKVNGFLGVMPAYSPEDEALAVKLVTFFPQNTGVPTHNAIIPVFNAQTGIPEILMDGEVITTMRTAAVSAIATKHLCAPNPQVLAVLGSGVQARSHIQALSSIMSFQKINIWSRTKKNAMSLAGEVGGTAYDTAEEAVKDADVIVTVTSSATPVLKKEWVKPGGHINAVGACRPDWQEIDPDLVRASVLYVDSRDAALKESGDVILSKAEIFSELGEMLLGLKEAKVRETTLFKSLGLAIEDVMSAKLVQDLLTKK